MPGADDDGFELYDLKVEVIAPAGGAIYCGARPGDYFELNPLATALVGRRSGFSYRLGDGIRVRVERIEKPSGRVSLEVVSGRGATTG